MNMRLTLGTKVRYGLADLGFALITSAMQFFLLFYYTDVAGINPALAGLALMVGKLTWDAFNDPLFGYWSDRTRSRFGRRRIYMLIGAVPLGIAAWIMFSLPKGLTGVTAFLAVLLNLLAGRYLPHHDHHLLLRPDPRAHARLQRARQPDLDPHGLQRGRLHPGRGPDHHPGGDLPGRGPEPAAGLERHRRRLRRDRHHHHAGHHPLGQGTTPTLVGRTLQAAGRSRPS